MSNYGRNIYLHYWMKKICCGLVLFLHCALLCAQPQAFIDSLKKDIDHFQAQDSFRAKAIYKYLKANINNNTSGDLPYIQEMVKISGAIHFKYGVSRGLQMFVTYYGDRGDFTTSFLYADTLATLFKSDTSYDAKRTLGILHSNLANNYIKMAYYEKAIDNYLQAVQTFEQLKDTGFAIQLYLNISSVYSNMADTIKPSQYTLKAVQLAEVFENEQFKIITWLGYEADLGTLGDYKTGQAILDKAIPLLKKFDYSAYWQSYYYLKGSFLSRQDESDKPFPFFCIHLHMLR